MAITVHIYDTGTDGSARKFAEGMAASGIADAVRAEEQGTVGDESQQVVQFIFCKYQRHRYEIY